MGMFTGQQPTPRRYSAEECAAIAERVAAAPERYGRWVTTEDDQKIYIDGGKVLPHGPGTKPAGGEKTEGKKAESHKTISDRVNKRGERFAELKRMFYKDRDGKSPAMKLSEEERFKLYDEQERLAKENKADLRAMETAPKDEPEEDAETHDKYADGRMKPKTGDMVYQKTAGGFGSTAVLRGKVTETKGGKLMVEIVGGGGGIAMAPVGKKIALDPSWTVHDDPMIVERERKQKEAEQRKADESKASKQKHEESVAKAKEKHGALKTANKGDVIEKPDTNEESGGRFIVDSVSEDGSVSGRREDEPASESYGIGRIEEFHKPASAAAKPQDEPAKGGDDESRLKEINARISQLSRQLTVGQLRPEGPEWDELFAERHRIEEKGRPERERKVKEEREKKEAADKAKWEAAEPADRARRLALKPKAKVNGWHIVEDTDGQSHVIDPGTGESWYSGNLKRAKQVAAENEAYQPPDKHAMPGTPRRYSLAECEAIALVARYQWDASRHPRDGKTGMFVEKGGGSSGGGAGGASGGSGAASVPASPSGMSARDENRRWSEDYRPDDFPQDEWRKRLADGADRADLLDEWHSGKHAANPKSNAPAAPSGMSAKDENRRWSEDYRPDDFPQEEWRKRLQAGEDRADLLDEWHTGKHPANPKANAPAAPSAPQPSAVSRMKLPAPPAAPSGIDPEAARMLRENGKGGPGAKLDGKTQVDGPEAKLFDPKPTQVQPSQPQAAPQQPAATAQPDPRRDALHQQLNAFMESPEFAQLSQDEQDSYKSDAEDFEQGERVDLEDLAERLGSGSQPAKTGPAAKEGLDRRRGKLQAKAAKAEAMFNAMNEDERKAHKAEKDAKAAYKTAKKEKQAPGLLQQLLAAWSAAKAPANTARQSAAQRVKAAGKAAQKSAPPQVPAAPAQMPAPTPAPASPFEGWHAQTQADRWLRHREGGYYAAAGTPRRYSLEECQEIADRVRLTGGR